METFVTIVHITACIFLILVVLLQSGKGAEISTTLGGSSQTVFGSSGGANFFTRFTATMAAVFMVTSVALTILQSQGQRSIFEDANVPHAPTNPVAPMIPGAGAGVDNPAPGVQTEAVPPAQPQQGQ